jgi:hypothetical protein
MRWGSSPCSTSSLVERHGIEREQNVLLDPSRQVADGTQNACFLSAVPSGVKRGIIRPLLFRLWQLGDFERMADADFVCQKCLCDGWMQLDQPKASGHERRTFPGFRR